MPPTYPHQMRPSITIIGIGNADRGDDGIGLAIAHALSEEAPKHVNVHRLAGNCISLLNLWQQADIAIVIDAVRAVGKPGTIHRIDAHHQPLPQTLFGNSSHSFGVAQAVELARSLHQLPPSLILYGVTGQTFEPGASLSTQVAQALPTVVERICKEVQAYQ